MIVAAALTGGTLIGFIIGLVGAWRGRVIAAVVVTRARTVVVWVVSVTHLHLIEPHRGHHTPRYQRYQRLRAALADTQQWPAVTP